MSSRANGSGLRLTETLYCYRCHCCQDFVPRDGVPTADGTNVVLPCPDEDCDGTRTVRSLIVCSPGEATNPATHT